MGGRVGAGSRVRRPHRAWRERVLPLAVLRRGGGAPPATPFGVTEVLEATGAPRGPVAGPKRPMRATAISTSPPAARARARGLIPRAERGRRARGATAADPRAAFGSPLGGGGDPSFAHVERVSGIGPAGFFGSGAWIVVIPLFDREGPTASPQIGHLETFPTCQAEDQKTSPHEQDAGVIFFLTLSSGGTASFVPHAGQAASFPASRSRTQKSPLQEHAYRDHGRVPRLGAVTEPGLDLGPFDPSYPNEGRKNIERRRPSRPERSRRRVGVTPGAEASTPSAAAGIAASTPSSP